jgi:hypothetical protein
MVVLALRFVPLIRRTALSNVCPYLIFDPCAVVGSPAASPACSRSGSPFVWPSQCSCTSVSCTVAWLWSKWPLLVCTATLRPSSIAQPMRMPGISITIRAATTSRSSAAALVTATLDARQSESPQWASRCRWLRSSKARRLILFTIHRASSRLSSSFPSATVHPPVPPARSRQRQIVAVVRVFARTDPQLFLALKSAANCQLLRHEDSEEPCPSISASGALRQSPSQWQE